MPDPQTMKRIYTELIDAVSSGNAAIFDDVMTDDYVYHGQGGMQMDREGSKAMVNGYYTAFPDMQMTSQHMVVEGDLLASYWTVTGTHTGPMGEVEATGRRINISGHVLTRFEGDKIAEEWEMFDEALMMEQLGLTES